MIGHREEAEGQGAGESTCRLGGFRHDGKVANPKGCGGEVPLIGVGFSSKGELELSFERRNKLFLPCLLCSPCRPCPPAPDPLISPYPVLFV
ncbi:hypothetical protein NIES2098_38750 [Calothrix sp. NIES-2098]|nr:hypothetical protein NIES2098_38750 [Calothrix sp. NIES-2098]